VASASRQLEKTEILSKHLRRDILKLSIFVDRRALKSPSYFLTNVETMININQKVSSFF
jgi:hypothetical protein